MYSLSLLLLQNNSAQAQIVIAPQPYINASGVPVGPILAPRGACISGSISYSFGLNPDQGFIEGGAGSGIGVCLDATEKYRFSRNLTLFQFTVASDSAISWGSSALGTPDLYLRHSALKTLTIDTDGAGGALTAVNIGSPVVRIFNTTIDGTNYERADLSWLSNVYTIGTYSGGTGTARNVRILSAGNNIFFSPAGSDQYTFGVSSFTFNNDNSNDIGNLGALRPRTGYFGTSVIQGGALNLTTTSTDGINLINSTAASGGATVQISPRTKWCGTAYNSSGGTSSETDCWITEVLPVTVAGATYSNLKFSYSNAGGAYTQYFAITAGGGMSLGNITPSTTAGYIDIPAAGYFRFLNRSGVASTADKLIQNLDNAAATGVEINLSAATLGTCTGGTIVTGSHSETGGYTGNTSSACTINFSTSWTNAPFCFAMSRASATHPHVTAVSTSAVTFTGGVSGEQIDFHCEGRIGT